MRVSTDGRDVVTPISVTEWLLHYYGQHSQLLHSAPYHPLPLPTPCPPLSSVSSPTSYPASHYGAHECLHEAGEVLFIPHGWWHLAVNVTPSVAVTQNVVTEQNLLDVRQFLREEGNAALGEAFERRLSEAHPGLVEQLEKTREEVDRWRRQAEEGTDKVKSRTSSSSWASMIA